MWPFKPKVDYRVVCGEYYASQAFFPMVTEDDLGQIYWDAAFKSIVDADPPFSAVDKQAFQLEFKALIVELFGLAWVHRLEEEKYILAEVIFESQYVVEVKQPDVWEAMADYNRTVGASSNASMTKRRLDLASGWGERGIDEGLATRAANRIGTAKTWDSGVTPQMLADTFQKRLGREVSSVASARVQTLISLLYGRALDSIKAVRVKLD